jgi:hypothetical protein
MENYDLNLLKNQLQQDLQKQLVSSRSLLDRFCVIDEASRKSPAYLDPNFASFYYHLGKYIKPKYMIEFGFDLGLLSGCFLTSCKAVEGFLGFREKSKEFASVRLGRQNIKKSCKGERNFYIGEIYDQEFESLFNLHSWDLAIFTDEGKYDKHLGYYDFIWSRMNDNGIIVAEYVGRHAPAKDAYFAFCKSKNREPLIFKTRYGTGLIQK